MNISRINPAVTRLAGYAPAELVKVPLGRIIRIEVATPVAADVAQIAEMMKAGRGVHDVPAVMTAKDGTALPVHLTLAPLLDNNKVVGGVVTLRIDPRVMAAHG
jgi:PAS domain S-box-containing protein